MASDIGQDGATRPLLADVRAEVDTIETNDLPYGTGATAEAAEAEAEAAAAEAVAGAVPRDQTQIQGSGTFNRNLGTLDAFAIIISIVIGSGIFTSPGSIDTNVPSPGVSLVVWLVGGFLAWTGASTMAELGTAIPGEGTSCSSFHLHQQEPRSAQSCYRWCAAVPQVHLRRYLGPSLCLDLVCFYNASHVGHSFHCLC